MTHSTSQAPLAPVAVAVACAIAASHWLSARPGAGPAARHSGPPIVRDAEIEQLLREYTQPILKAAGLAQQNIQVVIINQRSFNAFVADGRRIFINAGALMDAETPNQVIGVLAHETGHIAGGHLSRLREQLASGDDTIDHRHPAWRRRHGGRRRARGNPDADRPAWRRSRPRRP